MAYVHFNFIGTCKRHKRCNDCNGCKATKSVICKFFQTPSLKKPCINKVYKGSVAFFVASDMLYVLSLFSVLLTLKFNTQIGISNCTSVIIGHYHNYS